MYIAFYKAEGNWLNKLIRFVTKSQYSHCELVPEYDETKGLGHEYLCYSSSSRDGGVREKLIDMKPDHWDVFHFEMWDDLDEDPSLVGWFFEKRDHLKYDWIGAALCTWVAIRIGQKSRYFCSEICAEYLGVHQPNSLSPATFHDWLIANDARMVS